VRVLRTNTGPYPVRLTFAVEEIDDLCLDALRSAGCLPDSPSAIRIDRFIEKRFTQDVGYEDLPHGFLGYTIFRKDGSIECVRVSSKLEEEGGVSNERRLRSTWAHEAGHCLLHPMLFTEDASQGAFGQLQAQAKSQDRKILCRNTEVLPVTIGCQRRYDGRWWEWQANRAIGGFLLPKALVTKAIEPFSKPALITGMPTLPAAGRAKAEKDLAELFDVNPAVVKIRLSELFPDQRGQIEF
jgi:hypothetical protein